MTQIWQEADSKIRIVYHKETLLKIIEFRSAIFWQKMSWKVWMLLLLRTASEEHLKVVFTNNLILFKEFNSSKGKSYCIVPDFVIILMSLDPNRTKWTHFFICECTEKMESSYSSLFIIILLGIKRNTNLIHSNT